MSSFQHHQSYSVNKCNDPHCGASNTLKSGIRSSSGIRTLLLMRTCTVLLKMLYIRVADATNFIQEKLEQLNAPVFLQTNNTSIDPGTKKKLPEVQHLDICSQGQFTFFRFYKLGTDNPIERRGKKHFKKSLKPSLNNLMHTSCFILLFILFYQIFNATSI